MNNERGISLILTFFIMVIVLSVILSISVILYSEVRVVRNMSNSMVSFYAAESGIEKILYYDRQVLPVLDQDADGNNILAERGLCSMFDQVLNPINYCNASGSLDQSLYCQNSSKTELAVGGCDAGACKNCTIQFNTFFDNRTYDITASVATNGNTSYYLDAKSNGAFNGTGRQIEINTP